MDPAHPSLKSRGPALPSHSYHKLLDEDTKPSTRSPSFFTRFYIPVPGRRRIAVPLLIPSFATWRRVCSKRLVFLIWSVLVGLGWLIWHFYIRKWPTLVYGRDDLQRIWNWEIASGHYPSHMPIPDAIRMVIPPLNPGIPAVKSQLPKDTSPSEMLTSTIGIGSKRQYINVTVTLPDIRYPPRVPTGSVADLDVIMDHCDFSRQKYVRDCLEVLRLGAGLEADKHLRVGDTARWKYIYREEPSSSREALPKMPPLSAQQKKLLKAASSNSGLSFRGSLEKPLTNLPSPTPAKPFADLPGPCDPDYPKIFHVFWAGPFNEKPYVAILSFLYTQNLGLHLETPDPTVCRPQFWMWINPGPAAAVPNPNAVRDMFRGLSESPWAAPFLHPRFKDVIKFKMWNTTEQLDGVPELKDEWRKFEASLFSSAGKKFNVPAGGKKKEAKAAGELAKTAVASAPYIADLPRKFGNSTSSGISTPASSAIPEGGDKQELADLVGSSSSSTYDRLSVVLSDMARFILCHRFGGIYLDADTVFLRDWEELWGWKGAFAYRWSRIPTYNTAVLRLHKGSALGTFLFRTALRNNFDFHPWFVHDYVSEGHLDQLLLRLPDALFDSAWLSLEGYQRDRPPFPMFTDFYHFFQSPSTDSAAPQMLGFDGFYRGAYSYHFHNFWWVPFDPSRNFPDLGHRFQDGEYRSRAKLLDDAAAEAAKQRKANAQKGKKKAAVVDDTESKKGSASGKLRYPTVDEIEDMEKDDRDTGRDARDLSWSAVLKRTFEAYIRGEQPNMYGEWIRW